MTKGKKLIPNDPTLTNAEKDAIAAVHRYENTLKVIDQFKIENAEVLKTYQELLDELEQTRQVADSAMRGVDASYGHWDRYMEKKTYNAAALYEALGPTEFLKLGGVIKKEPVYEIDPKTAEIAIAAEKIPKEIVEKFRKITPSYRAPKPVGG